jgi:CBS domain containing-hemolysin-like protein
LRAATPVSGARDPQSGMIVRFALLIVILAANGFFAAAEVSLVSVRQSRLRQLAEQGQPGAQSALNLLANPGRLLSVTQVGVTLASLGLGWAGEGTLYDLLRSAADAMHVAAHATLLHGIAFALAFLIISYAHVIIGEVVPKNVAIQKADRVAVLAAPALLVFYRISQPFVVVIERTSALVLRMLGTEGGHARGGHTPEELKYIIQSYRGEGMLAQFEQNAIQRIIDLSEYSAREIMTPRHSIVSLPVDADLEQVLQVMTEHKFSRIPVYEDRPEQIIGIIHYKDLMRVWDERRFAHDRRRTTRPFRLRRFVRKPLVVPESKPLNQLIEAFEKSHTHMALVVDEFGTVSGLVTLEDVLQEVFGDIGDEHDDVRPPAPSHHDHALKLDAGTTIRDLETRYNVVLPGEAGFETLAGFLLFQFGFIPKQGDSVEYGGRRFTVTRMQRNRIAEVLVEKLEPKVEDPVNES